MTRAQWFAASATLLLLALGAIWFLRHFELREVPVPNQPDGEAATNPLTFTREFLIRMGLPAATGTPRLATTELPAEDAVLLLDTGREGIDADRADALLGWVARGGHLIARAMTPERNRGATPAPDPLFEALGITTRYVPDLAYPDAAERLRFTSRNGTRDQANVFFVGYNTLEGHTPDDEILSDANGVHLLHRRIGAGAVTLLSDMDFLHNTALCEHDHALALWHLVNRHREPAGAIWLVHSEDYPLLPVLLWQRAAPVFIASLILLAGWLWRSGSRFGPLLPQPTAERRRLLEHIEAGALYRWRNGNASGLIAALRREVEGKTTRGSITESEREAEIARQTGQPIATIRRLLRDDPPASPEAFTTFVAALDAIRRDRGGAITPTSTKARKPL